MFAFVPGYVLIDVVALLDPSVPSVRCDDEERKEDEVAHNERAAVKPPPVCNLALVDVD